MCDTANGSFDGCGRPAYERFWDWAEFAAGVGLAYGAPVLLYCLVINQPLRFYVIVCHLAVGVLGGFWLYKRRAGGASSDEPDGPDTDGSPALAVSLLPAAGGSPGS